MIAIKSYFGKSKNWHTYLEIYSKRESGGTRQIHRQLRDQEAYDAWHLSFYLKEILTDKRLLQKRKINFEMIPRKEKNLLMYLLMLTLKKNATVLELGHSLFELIDGLEVVKKYFRSEKKFTYELMVQNFSYFGVDISDDMCIASKILHPEYKIKTATSVESAPKHVDLLYDRNVTSYAFTSARDVAEFINRSEVALLNLFLSKGDTFYSRRLGKTLTYFSIKELVRFLHKPLFHLFGEKSPGPFKGTDLSLGKPVIEGFFLYGNPSIAQKFIEMSVKHPKVRKYFDEKKIKLVDLRKTFPESEQL